MSRRPLGPSRAGVTLTEILIAMLVMAIGLLGLFALFPLGLLNVTRAVTHNRSEALAQSAEADLQSHNLLAPERYLVGSANPTAPLIWNNPFVHDWDTAIAARWTPATWVVQPGRPGLPVVIDPIWIRANGFPPPTMGRLGRIGNLLDAIADDGLQRVIPADGLNNDVGDVLTDAADTTGDGIADAWPDFNEQFLSVAQTEAIFAGRDDLVFREDDASLPLPLRDPAGQIVGLQSERNYTWLAIARLADVSDPRTYEVSIATFYKRNLGVVDPVTNTLVGGEEVLRAVYLPDLANDPTGKTPSNRVILRWPAAAAEPDLRREGWILDATYSVPAAAGPHRGFWYHYVQVSEPRLVASAPPEVHVTLTLDAPVRETTWNTPTTAGTLPGITFNETGLQLFDGVDNNGNGLTDMEDIDVTNTAMNVAVIIPGVVSVYERTMHAQ